MASPSLRFSGEDRCRGLRAFETGLRKMLRDHPLDLMFARSGHVGHDQELAVTAPGANCSGLLNLALPSFVGFTPPSTRIHLVTLALEKDNSFTPLGTMHARMAAAAVAGLVGGALVIVLEFLWSTWRRPFCIASQQVTSPFAIRIWGAFPPCAALHDAEERITFALEPHTTLGEAVLAEVPAQTVRSTARRHNDARSFFVGGSSE